MHKCTATIRQICLKQLYPTQFTFYSNLSIWFCILATKQRSARQPKTVIIHECLLEDRKRLVNGNRIEWMRIRQRKRSARIKCTIATTGFFFFLSVYGAVNDQDFSYMQSTTWPQNLSPTYVDGIHVRITRAQYRCEHTIQLSALKWQSPEVTKININ